MGQQPHLTVEPRSVAGVIRHSLRLYRQNAEPLWRVLVPLAFLAQLVTVVLTLASLPAGSFVNDGKLYVAAAALGRVHAAGIAALVFEALLGTIAAGTGVRLLGTAALGHPQEPGEAFSYAFRRGGPLIWVSILYLVAVVAGGFLLVLPAFYIGTAFALAIPVLVIEDLRGVAALQRSRQLVRGRWCATFAALVPPTVLSGGVAVAITLALRPSGSITAFVLGEALVGLVVWVFVAPLSMAALAAVYTDLRARNEPEPLVASFGVDPPAAAAMDPWA
jgi:hypothetical protein